MKLHIFATRLISVIFPSCRFSSFEDVSSLLYMFAIADGPIWSIRFHPFVIASDDRIGLLAVSTANQNVYVFSLPYLKHGNDESNRNLVISLEPSIICKLSDQCILYQDKYMMQVSTVCWCYRKDEIQLLAAGYVNGLVAIWRIEDTDVTSTEKAPISLLPHLVFQPHGEIVTSIDFKGSVETEILMLTTSMDRETKIFVIEDGQYQEVASHYGSSRNTCAEWSMHWPGFLYGNDNCFFFAGLSYRQPIEFATRNMQLLQCFSSIMDLNINHWLNFAIFVCDSGDVFASNPSQLIHSYPKDKWKFFGNTVLAYTDVVKLDESSGECGIIFNDVKVI
jgi:hypothetical protein